MIIIFTLSLLSTCNRLRL